MEKMSKWYRWDLHIHTPNTQINDGFVDKNGSGLDEISVWKNYCNALNEYGADALGITDYFSAKNFFDLRNNRKAWGLNANIVIFPNIELRLNDLVSKKRAEKGKETSNVNVHLIFSPDVEEESLKKFLRELKVSGPNGRKLNYFDDLKQIIIGDRVDRMPTSAGMLAALRSTFGDNYSESVLIMIPNSDDGINLADGNGSGNGRQFIQDDVDLIQAREKKGATDRKYLLRSDNHYGKVFPAVTGCDAHRLEQIKDFPASSYTWIEAERTFEGLKQIIYEPELRVKIQENKPELPVKSKFIQSLELGNSNFEAKTLEFSDGLNTIIGGRSSGKSVLLSVISKLASGVDRFKSNNVKYDELINRLSDKCVLRYADGSSSSVVGKIQFIYQDGLQEIARDRNKRSKFVENVLSDLTDVDAIKEENSLYWQRKHDDLISLVSQLKACDQRINDQKSKIADQQDVNTLNKNIAKLIDSVQKRQDQAENIDQNSVNAMLGKDREFQVLAKETAEDLKDLRHLKAEKIVQLNPRIGQYTQQIVKDLDLKWRSRVESLDEDFQKEVDEKIQEKEQFIGENNEKIKELRSSDLYKNYYKQQQSTPELMKFQSSLEEQRRLLKNINNIIENLNEIKTARCEIVKEIIAKLDFRDGLFTKNIYCAENESLNFQMISEINVDEFVNLVSSFFKTSSVAFRNKVEAGNTNVEETATINVDSILEMMNRCLDLGDMLPGNDSPYRSGKSLYSWIEQFSNMEFIDIHYRVTYKSQNFSDMSEGKQAFVLLLMQLGLDADDKPFLIDQPEDELDNKAIYNDLVSYLREQKKHRQLFVVTHNANVLVGGDSECVTLAEERMDKDNGRRFFYTQGPIEDSKMQSSVCEVLEGGQRAFKKREERYAFSRNN